MGYIPMREGIPFYLDVRGNQYFSYKGKRYQIREYMRDKKRASIDGISMYGQQLSIAMKYQPQKKKTILAIITNTRAKKALGNYENRWSIEITFQAWKTRGFHLENTHLKDPNRLRKLLLLCTLALLVCVLSGITIHQKKKPIIVKNHGYKANSFFRYGLNFMRQIAKTNQKLIIQQQTQELLELVVKQLLNNIYLNYNTNPSSKIVM